VGIPERREREKQAVRDRILDAAREIFAAEGYDGVTMRRIAEAIEYSPTTIYLHFPDKETLVRELCHGDFLSLAKAFQKLALEPDPIERLRGIGRAYFDFASDHPTHYRLMFMTPRGHDMSNDDALGKGNPEEDAYAFLKATVAEAIAMKRFRPGLRDADLIAQAAWAGTHGVISLHIAKGQDPWVDWRSAKETAALVIDSMIDGLTKG